MTKKRILSLFFALQMVGLVLAFSACANDPPPAPKESRVRIAEIPEGVRQITDIAVCADGEKIPLYAVKTNRSQAWSPNPQNRTDSAFGCFELLGKTNITVELPYEIDYSSIVRPLSAGIIPVADIAGRKLRFQIKSAGSYIIEPNGDRNLAITLFVSEFSDPKAEQSGYGKVVYFGSGLHTAGSSELIDSKNTVTLSSDTLVYIDRGAVVRARFVANNAEHIAIVGGGVIDGSTFDRNATAGVDTKTVPIDFSFCKDVTLKDFACFDPAGWCVNSYFSEDITIENIKIVSSRSNGDGISLQSNRNAKVKGCFVRSWDDSLVVKNYPVWSNRNVEGQTENILFEDCVIWTDLAQSMEIGYETVGKTFKNVRFQNITVVHALHKPPISIHNANNGEIEDVEYRNITIEDASMGGGDAASNNQLIELSVAFSNNWSSQHKPTALGNVKNVRFYNIAVLSGAQSPLKITVSGCEDKRAAYAGNISTVTDVVFENITLYPESSVKRVFVGSDYRYFSQNEYTGDIVLRHDGKVSSGAAFVFSMSDDELKEFTDVAVVTRI